ncbi:olfactory receptor 1019-like [Spea bombifrons]|uniref:olfactory receptor 1019-like n=1 Tax=Spea bombifrons TaxID=233779 RepID=UPI002349976F|nr:olfactory receptor 1019-like [Spea bombifrons]
MDKGNGTAVREFILAGLSELPELQPFLFVMFACIYTICLLGNMAIIFVYKFSPNLHIPMYFYLANFSFLEICYVSTTVPKMLSTLLTERKMISFHACAVQMYCFLLLGSAECYMLAAMAYDRYNAICRPLLYGAVMTKRACVQLIVSSWLIGAVNALIHTALTFTLSFCGVNKIKHFFCDIPPVLELACADTKINEITMFVICSGVIIGSFILTMLSYARIITTILNIHSDLGRKKAFSTCTSHLIVAVLFYGSGMFMYVRPKSSYSMGTDRLVAVAYAVIAPLLNPFIYSLRNSDMKIAGKKLLCQICLVQYPQSL